MEFVLGAFTVQNEWITWVILSILLVALYFVLRHTIWRGEHPEERKILKKFLIVFFVSVIITILVVQGMKYGFNVPRPCIPCTDGVSECNLYCPDEPSFPSGHSAMIFTLFTSFFLIYRKKHFLPFFIFPALVAYSRVFLGVHTWIDIIVGSAIGIIIPVMVWKAERIFKVLKA